MKKIFFEQPTVQALAKQFREAGYEFYLVGGAVRDLLLNRRVNDWDCTTDARPDAITELLKDSHPDCFADNGKKYGTIKAGYYSKDPDCTVEVTTYLDRAIYRTGSRNPTVTFGSSLQEDLARRDFTINAMALDPLTGLLIDPFEGNADLNHSSIVAIGNANELRTSGR